MGDATPNYPAARGLGEARLDFATRGTVHIVDDDPAIATSLATVVRSAGLQARSHASAEDFLANFDPKTTGCVVTDARMPGMSGLELQQAVKARDAATAVIMITGHAAASLAVQALKGGAADFIEKPVDDATFLAAVRGAVESTRREAQRQTAQAAVAKRLGQLSVRERQVLELVVEGLSSPVIGQTLGISARTVESHRARVMDKMGAANLADLIRMTLLLREDAAWRCQSFGNWARSSGM